MQIYAFARAKERRERETTHTARSATRGCAERRRKASKRASERERGQVRLEPNLGSGCNDRPNLPRPRARAAAAGSPPLFPLPSSPPLLSSSAALSHSLAQQRHGTCLSFLAAGARALAFLLQNIYHFSARSLARTIYMLCYLAPPILNFIVSWNFSLSFSLSLSLSLSSTTD